MKKDKLLQKAINNAQNLRFSEFQKLLQIYSFEYVRTRGSHLFYKNSRLKKALPVVEKDGFAREYQVKQFLRILEEGNVI